MNVFVVRLSSLGDVILTTPVFEYLKEARTSCRVSVLVKRAFAPVFEGNPFIDEVLLFEDRGLFGWAREIRRRRFDVFLDLHDTIRSRLWGWSSGAGKILRYDKRVRERRRLVRDKTSSPRLAGRVVDRYLDTLSVLGVPATARTPRLYFERGTLGPVLASRAGTGPFLGVVPGAAHATKRWPSERFAEAADALMSSVDLSGGKVLILGSAEDLPAARAVAERLRAPSVNLAGETTTADLFRLLAQCRLVLTNDSGAMHAAAALDVPTVAVFGPTVEAFGFFPVGPKAAVVQVDGLACRPCHLHGEHGVSKHQCGADVHGAEVCPLGHFRCMKDLSADRVVDAARDVGKIIP